MRYKKEDTEKRAHEVKVRLNNVEYNQLVELTKKRKFKTLTKTIREAIRHDFVWYVKGREDCYY